MILYYIYYIILIIDKYMGDAPRLLERLAQLMFKKLTSWTYRGFLMERVVIRLIPR